jgi:hypothetical protein
MTEPPELTPAFLTVRKGAKRTYSAGVGQTSSCATGAKSDW